MQKQMKHSKGLKVSNTSNDQKAQKKDPSFSVVVKIAEALGLSLSDFFRADDIFNDTNSHDKTLVEKLQLLDSLDDNEKKSIYTLIDSLISKKKLKDNLQNLANS